MVETYLSWTRVPMIGVGIATLATLIAGCSNPYDLSIREGDIVKVNANYLEFSAQDPEEPCGGNHCSQWVDTTQDSLCEVLGIEEFQRDTLTKEGNDILETAYDIRLHCDKLGENGVAEDGVGRLAVTRAELDSSGKPVIYLATFQETKEFKERNSWLHRTFPTVFYK